MRGVMAWVFVRTIGRRPSLEDYVSEENPVRVVEVFIDELDLAALGFAGMTPAATGRPAYHPSTLLKIYLYGYPNRDASPIKERGFANSTISCAAKPSVVASSSPVASRCSEPTIFVRCCWRWPGSTISPRTTIPGASTIAPP
jgi:hypothetical protein